MTLPLVVGRDTWPRLSQSENFSSISGTGIWPNENQWDSILGLWSERSSWWISLLRAGCNHGTVSNHLPTARWETAWERDHKRGGKESRETERVKPSPSGTVWALGSSLTSIFSHISQQIPSAAWAKLGRFLSLGTARFCLHPHPLCPPWCGTWHHLLEDSRNPTSSIPYSHPHFQNSSYSEIPLVPLKSSPVPTCFRASSASICFGPLHPCTPRGSQHFCSISLHPQS